MLRLILAIVLITSLVAPAVAQQGRTVAITLDDLPYLGGTLAEAEWATDELLEALAAHEAPADVFVTGKRVEVEDEGVARRELLRRWLGSGHALQNHSYSHLHYSAVEPVVYLADVERGYELVESLLAKTAPDERVHFFRAPYNDLGESATTRTRLAEALDERDVRLAPFTVEHADYAFDALYRDALARSDSAYAGRIGAAYLAQLDSAFAFAEQLSLDTFGREIPQVFLIHANRINADYLGAMLGQLAERGYMFVTLDEAVRDPAYATEDTYLKKWGVSWLHRWRVALDRPSALREEPELPAWVLSDYQALSE